jgi:hypothetical protein
MTLLNNSNLESFHNILEAGRGVVRDCDKASND